ELVVPASEPDCGTSRNFIFPPDTTMGRIASTPDLCRVCAWALPWTVGFWLRTRSGLVFLGRICPASRCELQSFGHLLLGVVAERADRRSGAVFNLRAVWFALHS